MIPAFLTALIFQLPSIHAFLAINTAPHGVINSATDLTLATPLVFVGTEGAGNLTCSNVTADVVTGTNATFGGVTIVGGEVDNVDVSAFWDEVVQFASTFSTGALSADNLTVGGAFLGDGDYDGTVERVDVGDLNATVGGLSDTVTGFASTFSTVNLTASGTIAATGALSGSRVTIGTAGGGNACRLIYNAYLTDTTAGTGAEDVRTVTVPAGTMSANGDLLDFEGWVKCAATANNKTVAVVFDGGTFETSTQACNGNNWRFHAQFRRVNATNLLYTGGLSYTSEGAGTTHIYTGTPTWANALNFVVRLTTPTTPGDATLYRLKVIYCPAVP